MERGRMERGGADDTSRRSARERGWLVRGVGEKREGRTSHSGLRTLSEGDQVTSMIEKRKEGSAPVVVHFAGDTGVEAAKTNACSAQRNSSAMTREGSAHLL